jgi:hypothetical protein
MKIKAVRKLGAPFAISLLTISPVLREKETHHVHRHEPVQGPEGPNAGL